MTSTCERCGSSYTSESAHRLVHEAEDASLKLIDDQVETQVARARTAEAGDDVTPP